MRVLGIKEKQMFCREHSAVFRGRAGAAVFFRSKQRSVEEEDKDEDLP